MSATLPRRAFLGAELPGDAEAFVDPPRGVRIAGAIEGGMAARAGLAAGDVLISLAGAPVGNLAELAAALRCAGAVGRASHASLDGAGEHVAPGIAELVVLRDGARLVRTIDVVPMPREQLDGADVIYGALAADGARLRTITIRTAAPRAVVLVVQGIACESIDHAMAADAPLAGLVQGWARAGVDCVRFDKRGVGDSDGGPCCETDFATELADARVALAAAARYAAERGVPLVVFGHSVGGIIASLVAGEAALAGVMVYGTPVTRWLDCLVDSVRRQLELRGAAAEEIAARAQALAQLADTGELNGRSAAYHAQLHALDLEAAWRAVAAPVLVLRGEHDWVVRADDQARIIELAGRGEIVDLAGLDHLFGHHADREASLRDYGIGAFDPAIVTATLSWLSRLQL